MTLPNELPVGLNNEFISNLSYQFYMTTYHVAVLEITDANSERYSIPESVANKPPIDYAMRLEMLGLQVFQNPFSF